MVGFVSPRKRCTYSAKNARVSVQSHGADLGDKGKRPNWRRFYYSPIENGKVVAPVNARFDDRTTTALQTQSWCLRGITRMECHRMRSIPTLNIRRLAAKDQLAYYSNYAERSTSRLLAARKLGLPRYDRRLGDISLRRTIPAEHCAESSRGVPFRTGWCRLLFSI